MDPNALSPTTSAFLLKLKISSAQSHLGFLKKSSILVGVIALIGFFGEEQGIYLILPGIWIFLLIERGWHLKSLRRDLSKVQIREEETRITNATFVSCQVREGSP